MSEKLTIVARIEATADKVDLVKDAIRTLVAEGLEERRDWFR